MYIYHNKETTFLRPTKCVVLSPNPKHATPKERFNTLIATCYPHSPLIPSIPNLTIPCTHDSFQTTLLGTFPTDTASKLHILRHDCDTLCMDSTQECILEQTNKVCLGCLLIDTIKRDNKQGNILSQ